MGQEKEGMSKASHLHLGYDSLKARGYWRIRTIAAFHQLLEAQWAGRRFMGGSLGWEASHPFFAAGVHSVWTALNPIRSDDGALLDIANKRYLF